MKRELKIINVRLPKPMWRFLKITAVNCETSMHAFILELINKEKVKREKSLTASNTKV